MSKLHKLAAAALALGMSAPITGGFVAPAIAVEKQVHYEGQQVRPGHSVSVAPATPLPGDAGADFDQSGIPEGWYVSINEDNGELTVSAAPNAKKGDSYTARVKIVDIDGHVEWTEVTFTVSEDGNADSALPPADSDGPQVTYEDATVEPGRSVQVNPQGDTNPDLGYDISQAGIPKGWYVTIAENGILTVSAGGDAKSGDSYTVKIKVVDGDGKVTWTDSTITVK